MKLIFTKFILFCTICEIVVMDITQNVMDITWFEFDYQNSMLKSTMYIYFGLFVL